MKPTIKSKTQEWTIEELLQVEPRIEWYRGKAGDWDACAATLYSTLVDIMREQCNKPSGALWNVDVQPGKVVVTISWLEMENEDAATEST
jgi:hypothetical protein